MAMQGDSYLIPIVVRQNDVVIEPQMVELLALKIGGIAKFYPGGGGGDLSSVDVYIADFTVPAGPDRDGGRCG